MLRNAGLDGELVEPDVLAAAAVCPDVPRELVNEARAARERADIAATLRPGGWMERRPVPTINSDAVARVACASWRSFHELIAVHSCDHDRPPCCVCLAR